MANSDKSNQNSNVHVLYLCKHCNLRCKYCYEKGKEYLKMPFETAKTAVDTIISENPNKLDHIGIILFGGEPLLNWDVLLKTVEYGYNQYHLRGYNLSFTIISNGTLMNKDRVRSLFPYSKILNIQISIDGDRETQNANRVFQSEIGSYDIVAKNCKNLLQYFPFATAKMVITDVDKFYDNVEHLRKVVGFREFDFLAVVGTNYKHGDYYINKFKETINRIEDEFSKLSNTRINQITYPPENNDEYFERKLREADNSDKRYKYFLPEGDRIVQKVFVNKSFEHFEKGENTSYNLLNDKCKKGELN